MIMSNISSNMNSTTNGSLGNITDQETWNVFEAMDEYQYVYLILSSMNSLFHIVGCTLLVCTYKQRTTPQYLFLINLSFVELVKSTLNVAILIYNFVIEFVPYQDLLQHMVLLNWMKYIATTAMLYLYYAAMFLITADRLVATLFPLKHNILCTLRRSKLVLLAAWLCCLVLSAVVLVTCYTPVNPFEVEEEDMEEMVELVNIYHIYIPTTIEVLFLVFGIACYLIMFNRYTKSSRSASSSQLTTFQIFKRSKFYVSILLLTSFLLLMVIPSILHTLFDSILIDSVVLINLCTILSILSDSADFVIYIFFYDPVYSFLKMAFAFVRRTSTSKLIVQRVEGEANMLTLI